jgi:aryl-alcohol dehydrogenase-like predicted oxidoreductase
MAHALDLAVTPWGPLAGGVLTGKYNPGAASDRAKDARYHINDFGGSYFTERNFRIADAVRDVAEQVGRSPAQVALSWLRRPGGPVIIPILGARTREQIEDNLDSLELELLPEQRARLDEVSAIDLGFPHDFLASDYVQTLVHGEHHDTVDVHR